MRTAMIKTLNTVLSLSILYAFISCNTQNQKSFQSKWGQAGNINIGDTVSELGKDIDFIFQDKNDHYWLASNGAGVYRYDGNTLIHISEKHGLCSNFVWTIQEDITGNLWFTGRDGVCRFNGTLFTNYTDTINNAPQSSLRYNKGGLFFGSMNGVCYFDGKLFTNFAIHPNSYKPEPNNMNRPYSVYSTFIDKSGNVWFGTQEQGVCRYDGNSFSFITEKGLNRAAVRSIFQDKAGNMWFGNNGAGLFRYDGATLTNFTEEKGLSNPEFLKKLKGKEGTLARVWSITEDNTGNLWIGTIDAGVWKYDGKQLTNYTTKDGLAGNSIWTIYKDTKGELWFLTNGETFCKFNGKSFTPFSFKQKPELK